jgi:hypothetical protein
VLGRELDYKGFRGSTDEMSDIHLKPTVAPGGENSMGTDIRVHESHACEVLSNGTV